MGTTKTLTYLFVFLCVVSKTIAQPVHNAVQKKEMSTDPVKVFLNPPEKAKPGVLWMWMGSNLSKEGITKDLNALKIAGFNRTTMFSLADITTPWAGEIKNSPTPELISWTEPWWKLVRYAAEESKRLGIDFGMFNGPSYESSGGVWITPELSMQEICWSDKTVSGGKNISVVLQRPQVNLKGHTPFPIYNGETGLVEIPEVAARKTYYKDIAVLAIPSAGSVALSEVINLTAFMQTDGRVEWNAPAGDWIIYRFGHTTTGTYIQPAQWKATGLECDKMSVEAVSFHIDHVIGEIQKHLGDLIGTGFTHIHFDSYEAGYPTWTPKMREEFLSRRGYDLTAFLPIFAGRIVGSKNDSIKFRNDFDATVKDLYHDVYFTIIANKLKAAHLRFLCEPYGGPWRQDEIMPLIENVMTEFWTNKGMYTPYELKPTVNALRKSGQNIIEAEAFTGDPADSKWDETPAWLKPIGDAAFCEGVNRLVLHRFVQQAFDERYKPGATMGRWGTHFDRTQTWWEPGKAMVTYWQRCQALLQWGRIVMPAADDFIVSDSSVKSLKYIHRKQENEDVYFVANTKRARADAVCIFKVSGRQPELWDPVTGEMRNLAEFKDDQTVTTIPLQFDAAQSFFIVFRKKASEKKVTAARNFPKQTELASITGQWSVHFDQQWGGPAKAVRFDQLSDWTVNNIKGIKYYSGTAVYKKSFNMPTAAMCHGKPVYMNLGIVNHIAKVIVNGKEIGIVWTAPWQIKLPEGILKKKNNQLIIEVTNVWANRLIGDEQEPADCEWLPGHISGGNSLKSFPDWFLERQPRPSSGRYCFTTWNYFTKDSPLVPSGLIGPVKIMMEQ